MAYTTLWLFFQIDFHAAGLNHQHRTAHPAPIAPLADPESGQEGDGLKHSYQIA